MSKQTEDTQPLSGPPEDSIPLVFARQGRVVRLIVSCEYSARSMIFTSGFEFHFLKVSVSIRFDTSRLMLMRRQKSLCPSLWIRVPLLNIGGGEQMIRNVYFSYGFCILNFQLQIYSNLDVKIYIV